MGLRNPHLQTVLAARLIRPALPPLRRERLELDDGDFLDLAHGGEAAGQRPTVCLFHGLAGGLGSSYVAGAFNALTGAGCRVTLMHWRGCSGEPNRLARSYHSGASEDIARMAALLAERHPGSPLIGLGYSLGGNALLTYLGQQGESAGFDAAIAVSPPLVLSVGADTLSRGAARGYQRFLLGLMRQHHEAKRRARPELDLPAATASLDTFWRFDDALTAPLHGFDGVHDYYQRCSARRWLGGIRRPVHILSAADDPFFSPAILPEERELAAGTRHEVSVHGGHVGFLSGWRTRWLDARVAGLAADLAADLVADLATNLGANSAANAVSRPGPRPDLHRPRAGHADAGRRCPVGGGAR